MDFYQRSCAEMQPKIEEALEQAAGLEARTRAGETDLLPRAGDLAMPIRPRFTSTGRIEIRNAGKAPVPAVIVFENRGGRIGFRAIGALKDSVEIGPPN